MYSVKWIGQGGFLLAHDGYKIAIDPYLSDLVEQKDGLRRLVPPAEKPEDFKPDCVIITHEHIDHLDTITIGKMDKSNVLFICSDISAEILHTLGVDSAAIKTIQEGDNIKIAGFDITAVYADHTPGSFGTVIKADGISAYFTGDSLYGEKVGKGIKTDVLMTCINGRWGNMTATEAADLAVRTEARLAIPNHYGMFAENTADPYEFTAELAKRKISSYIMEYNKSFLLNELLKEI